MPLYPEALRYPRPPSLYFVGVELDGESRIDVVDQTGAHQVLHLHDVGEWRQATISVEVAPSEPLRPTDRAIAVITAAATRQRWAISLQKASLDRWEGLIEIERTTSRGDMQVLPEIVTSGQPQERLAPIGLPAGVIYLDPPRTPLGKSFTPQWIDFVEPEAADQLGLGDVSARDRQRMVSHIGETTSGVRWYWNLANEFWELVMHSKRAKPGLKDLRLLLFELDADKALRTTVLRWLPEMLIDTIDSGETPNEDDLGLLGPILNLAMQRAGHPGHNFSERLLAMAESVQGNIGNATSEEMRREAFRLAELCANAVGGVAFTHKGGIPSPLPAVVDRLRHAAVTREEIGTDS